MISLFHSYQYIPNLRKNLSIDKNNNIIDDKLKFVFGLNNIPKTKSIYTPIINKIKQKKKSLTICRKKTNRSYINNFNDIANIKITIDLNYDKFSNYIINNNKIPDSDYFFKLLNRNVKQNLNLTDYLDDIYLYNERCDTDSIENTPQITFIPYNILNLNNTYVDIINETYSTNKYDYNINLDNKCKTYLYDTFNNYDNIIKLIKSKVGVSIFICDFTSISYWKKVLSDFSILSITRTNQLNINNNTIKKYKIIIISIGIIVNLFKKDINLDVSKYNLFNFKFSMFFLNDCLHNKFYINNVFKKINADIKNFITYKSLLFNYEDFIEVIDILYNYKLTIFDKKTIEYFKNSIIRNKNNKANILEYKNVLIEPTKIEKNFYKKNNNNERLYFSLSLNLTNQKFLNINNVENKNLKLDLNKERCSICLNKLSLNNLGITKCNHKFCYNCISDYLNYNCSCPICRNELKLKDIHYLVNNKTNYNIPSKIKYILEIKDKTSIVVISKYEESINSLIKFFNQIQISYSKSLNCSDKIKIIHYNDLLSYNTIKFNLNVIILEPFDKENKIDIYYRSILENFMFNSINILISKNTIEQSLI
jgi:hypothetical protein